MTDSPRREGDGPAQPYGDGYPGYTDPAYANQAPHGPTYQAPGVPAPTERLPEYSTYGYDPYGTAHQGAQPPPPPDGGKPPRWLWTVAAIAVLAVVGLVITLVVVNSSRQKTVVAPLPPDSTFTTQTSQPTTTSRTPTVQVPLPTVPSVPPTTGTTTPGATQTVVYDVEGDGRAINITYVDTGGVLQTEFNVTLPWSKEVQLGQPAKDSASVSIINVGREVDCSITVDGAVVQQRTGSG